MLELFFAYLGGLLTVVNPCVLPLLPIILASSAQSHKWGPVAMALGLGTSYVVLGLAINTLGQALGLIQEDIIFVSAIIMVAFGLVLLVPQANAQFAKVTGGFASMGNAGVDGQADNGLRGQFLSGALLGAVWSPCNGPIIGGTVGLAASAGGFAYATLIMLFFALGAMTIILVLSFGSRELVMRRRNGLMKFAKHSKTIMGVALVVVGVGILLGVDKWLETAILSLTPDWFLQLLTPVEV